MNPLEHHPITGSIAALCLLLAGCSPSVPQGSLIVTQTPSLDRKASLPYSEGSRIVAIPPDGKPEAATLLTPGLAAAGQPALSPDGSQLLFTGRKDKTDPWQVYRIQLHPKLSPPEKLTQQPHGAAFPAWLPNGHFIFISPPPTTVPPPITTPAIYAQSFEDGFAEQLTHTTRPVKDLTVLQDGRILFVSEIAAPPNPADALFTINNDGTEITAFAATHDSPSLIRHPRELPDGRVAFFAKPTTGPDQRETLQQVQLSHPFSSRQTLLTPNTAPAYFEPGPANTILVSQLIHPSASPGPTLGCISRLQPNGEPHDRGFDDPAYIDLEVVHVSPTSKPMGRLSTIDTNLSYGRILCLNANFTEQAAAGHPGTPAKWVRFSTPAPNSTPRVLGEAPIHEDGSFLATLPADLPLTLQTLDAQRQPIATLHTPFWLRPGENRACVGCHEPHNHAPQNLRPVAVNFPPEPLASNLTLAP
ncbi:MAG: hypothetical protein RI897_459 [Verrucomicrobiota bacterium]|jgi:hypothetical protein